MGLFTGLVRLQYLKMAQMDLEYKIQTITTTKLQLASNSADLVTIGSDLDPDSPEFKKLETRRQKLHVMEKKLDAELLKLNGLLKAINVEIDSAEKIVDNSIKRSFTYGGR